LELSALAEKIDTLEALQNTTFGLDGAFAFETGMLAHKSKKWMRRMVTDLQESNPNSSENLQEADSRLIRLQRPFDRK
jgi:hypothetical protein